MAGTGRVAAALGLCLALVLGVPTAAHATFPGLNGQIVFATGPTPDLFAINYDGSLARSVIIRPPQDYSPKLSPDGKQVAWTSQGGGQPL